jgi:hypothetical protein
MLDMQVAPGASWHAPQVQEVVQTSTPQLVTAPEELRSQPVRDSPGVQTPVLQEPQEP